MAEQPVTDERDGSAPELATTASEFRTQAWRPHQVALLILAGLVTAIIVLAFADTVPEQLKYAARDGTWLRRVFKVPNHLFPWWLMVVIVLGLVAQPRPLRLLVAFGIASAMCFGGVHLLKILLGRARPHLGAGPLVFVIIGDPWYATDSFPSGHSAQAILLTIMFAYYVPPTRWLFIPAATLASLGRVVTDRHWLTDVLGSLLLAVLAIHLSSRWLGGNCYPRWRRPTWSRIKQGFQTLKTEIDEARATRGRSSR